MNSMMALKDYNDDFESISGMVDTCHGDSGGPLACQVHIFGIGVVIMIVVSHIVFTTLLPSIKLILVPQSSPLRYIDNSLHHPEFAFQTADGSYKLVGIVNWGGGYCGEVQSHLQHCFLRKQLRSLFSREFAKSNPTTYSFICSGWKAGSVHTRAIL